MHKIAYDAMQNMRRLQMAARYAANKQIHWKKSEAAFRGILDRVDCAAGRLVRFQQARKLGRCDSYLRNLKLSLTCPSTTTTYSSQLGNMITD